MKTGVPDQGCAKMHSLGLSEYGDYLILFLSIGGQEVSNVQVSSCRCLGCL